MNSLIENLDRLHTTEMGAERVKRNLQIDVGDVAQWCRGEILNHNAKMERRGKNWYIMVNGRRITVNANSYTIITAHKADFQQ